MPLEEDLDATERLERMACLHRAADPLIAVQHENVLRVYGLEYHDGWGCVVAEYLEGVRLSELLAVEETLPPAQVAPLGAALASVMAAAQQVGIEIKGLSSDEIVMTGRGEIKVCSFVCRSESSGAVEAAGERGASGLCTLGALLYRCLTGRQPAVQPPGEKPARRAVTPISAFRPSVPADLERLIMGLMIFDTEEVRLSVPVVAGGLARVAEQHGWTWQAPRPVADAEGAQLRTAEAESEQVVSA